MEFKLKRLEHKNLDDAIAMARHYRDLNQPEEAESICRDILEVSPDHEEAWRTLGLALTDRFPKDWVHLFDEAIAAFGRLKSHYDRVYYSGVAWERFAKAQLEAGGAHNAIHAFEEAMQRFEEAERLGDKDSPDPILRYNRCVRAITTHPDLVRASGVPHAPKYEFGD
jgi:tetratricopeptide (TPR) repeat protein